MESTASKREIKQKSHCVCITDFFTKVKITKREKFKFPSF